MPYGEAPWIFTGRCVSPLSWSVGHECGLEERESSGRDSSTRFPSIDFAGQTSALLFFFFFLYLSTSTALSLLHHHQNTPHRALYQLQLVPLSEAKKHIPPEFHIVSLFG